MASCSSSESEGIVSACLTHSPNAQRVSVVLACALASCELVGAIVSWLVRVGCELVASCLCLVSVCIFLISIMREIRNNQIFLIPRTATGDFPEVSL